MIYRGILVEKSKEISDLEASKIIEQNFDSQREELKNNNISRIEMRLDGDEIVVRMIQRDPIIRIRRITGYLSAVSNFNDAKKAELEARTTHL